LEREFIISEGSKQKSQTLVLGLHKKDKKGGQTQWSCRDAYPNFLSSLQKFFSTNPDAKLEAKTIPGLGYVANNHGDRKSPKDPVVGPLPNGLFMAYRWRLLAAYKSCLLNLEGFHKFGAMRREVTSNL